MGLLLKRLPNRERRLTRGAVIYMVSGVFLSLVFLLLLLTCQLPCAENQGSYDYQQWKKGRNLLSPSKYSRYTLALLIISNPDNMQERNVIRHTWLSGLDKSVVLFRFVVGTAALHRSKVDQINQEDLVHNDMVLLNNVKDSYQDLTFKVLQTFMWLDKNTEYQYVLKVDDDSFVMVQAILSELRFKPKERLYWGFFDGRANVKTSGKWKETNWVLCDRYLPYARGGGYVLSFDLVNFIARNADILQLYLSEDVSVGTWLAPLKVNRHHDQRFDTEYVSRGCLNSYLVMHKQSSLNIQELHSNLRTAGVLCKTEVVLRGSYEYNWNYPPSQCCNRANVKRESASKNGSLT